MIRSGTIEEAKPDSGKWIFVDVGFSSGRKSCGFLVSDNEPEELQFGELKNRLKEHFYRDEGPLNLVLEAPLSCCFNSAGNPTGRIIEKREGEHRYWYSGAGATVLLASLDLLKTLSGDYSPRDIRLFEGFASFKNDVSSHKQDVLNLRDIIWAVEPSVGKVIAPEDLKRSDTDTIKSTLFYIGLDCKISPVLVVGA